MATLNLGAIRYNWKGAYNSSTDYVVNDVVSNAGNSYVCIQAHTTAQALGDATAYWNIMSSAGTNGTDGTDLTSTLSTRGDIAFKGASALERLPKGTAGYYLKQGANDPEWAELSGGDYVKLADTTTSGSESSISLNGFFSSTYDFYKILLSDFCMNADTGGHIGIRYMKSNANITGGYYETGSGTYRTSSTNTEWNGGSWNTSRFELGGWNMPTVNSSGRYRTTNFDITIPNPLSTAYYKAIIVNGGGGWERLGNYTWNISGQGSLSDQNALSGINIFNVAGGTFASGCRVVLYGLKS